MLDATGEFFIAYACRGSVYSLLPLYYAGAIANPESRNMEQHPLAEVCHRLHITSHDCRSLLLSFEAACFMILCCLVITLPSSRVHNTILLPFVLALFWQSDMGLWRDILNQDAQEGGMLGPW